MTLEEIYIFILNSNVINFIIMVSLLVLIFKKAKLGVVIDSLADDIKNNVTTSAEAVQNAIEEYKKARKNKRCVNEKKEEILNEAKSVALKLQEKCEKEISNKNTELEKNGEKLMEAHFERKKEECADSIQNVVYTLSYDVIESMLTPELQLKIIENSLEEFDKIKGGF